MMLVINNGTDKVAEYHAQFVAKKSILSRERKKPNGLGLNVALIMFDSQSAANVERAMPKSLKFLRRKQGTIELKGNSIVGDGTTAQLCAMLTGYNEHYLPDARKEHEGTGSVDKWPFIFSDFKQEGYTTMYFADDALTGAFQFRLRGFEVQPADHYSRPFFLEGQGRYGDPCLGPKSNHKIAFDFTFDFFKGYPNIPKFSLTEISVLTHGSLNGIQLADDEFHALLENLDRKGHLDNTVLVVFGDHGPRISEFRATINGKMEERLPFTSITFPNWFTEKHKDLFHTVKDNSQILTSHFDMYHTLKHILTYPELPKKTQAGQSLFTAIDPETRTCASAGVPDHFCPCLQFKEMDPKDLKIRSLAELAVEHINKLVSSFEKPKELCEKLKLDRVERAGKRKPNWKVEQFSSSGRNSRCDSCALVFDKSLMDVHSNHYEIVLTVLPGGGRYEITLKTDKERVEVDQDISRINRYGDQPKCIANDYPNLRKFCYCKKQEEIY